MPITDTAPYGTAAGIIKVLETFRETGLGGGPIDVQLVTRMSMGAEVARRVVLSLRLLELIDDEGKPTNNFIAFKQAPSAEYKQVFANLLLDVYAPIFAVLGRNLESKTPDEVEDAFRTFKQDSLRGRMVTCFLGLCEYAGLITDTGRTAVVPKPKTRPSAQKPRPPAPQGQPNGQQPRIPSPPAPDVDVPGVMRKTITLRSGGRVTLEVAVDLFALDDADHRYVNELVGKVKNYDGSQRALPAPSNGIGSQPPASKTEDSQ